MLKFSAYNKQVTNGTSEKLQRVDPEYFDTGMGVFTANTILLAVGLLATGIHVCVDARCPAQLEVTGSDAQLVAAEGVYTKTGEERRGWPVWSHANDDGANYIFVTSDGRFWHIASEDSYKADDPNVAIAYATFDENCPTKLQYTVAFGGDGGGWRYSSEFQVSANTSATGNGQKPTPLAAQARTNFRQNVQIALLWQHIYRLKKQLKESAGATSENSGTRIWNYITEEYEYTFEEPRTYEVKVSNLGEDPESVLEIWRKFTGVGYNCHALHCLVQPIWATSYKKGEDLRAMFESKGATVSQVKWIDRSQL